MILFIFIYENGFNTYWRYLEIKNDEYISSLASWYESLENPCKAQEAVLLDLLSKYKTTRYGKENSVEEVNGFEDFRRFFPKLGYKRLNDYLDEVRKGVYSAILHEPPEFWVMTRGSTGIAKVLPSTRTHLKQIFQCGSRAFANHISRTGDLNLARGKILNLSFPSRVDILKSSDGAQSYGYSSGSYSKQFPTFGDAGLIPTQDLIDSLGPGISSSDWERRFELVFSEARDKNVTAAMGVAPVILSFSKFIKRRYGKLPQDIWEIRAIFATSVRKIPFRYAPKFRKYYGQVPIIEIYSATEGVFAQQKDDLPYISPNYDTYLFEVETDSEVKMLHELKRGEWGRLIISTCMFPRYDIGDMIEAMGKNYFRVFGRAKLQHILEHRLYRLLFRWFL